MNFLIAPRIGNNRIERSILFWIFRKAFCSGPSLASLQSLLHHDSPAFVCVTPSRVSRPLTLSWMLWSTYRACVATGLTPMSIRVFPPSVCTIHPRFKAASFIVDNWQRHKCHLLKSLGPQPLSQKGYTNPKRGKVKEQEAQESPSSLPDTESGSIVTLILLGFCGFLRNRTKVIKINCAIRHRCPNGIEKSIRMGSCCEFILIFKNLFWFSLDSPPTPSIRNCGQQF